MDRKKQIGRDFTLLRKILTLTPPQAVEKSGGLLRRPELHKVEHGLSLVSTIKKRQAIAAALGVPVKVVALLAEQRISPEDAAKFAGQTDADVPFPDPDKSDVEKRGEDLAILSRLEHSRKAPFPRLELCLIYHEQCGKTWPPDTVAAARSGHFGREDMPPHDWHDALDELERIHEKARNAWATTRSEKKDGLR